MDESEESYLGTLCEVESRTEHRRTYKIYFPKAHLKNKPAESSKTESGKPESQITCSVTLQYETEHAYYIRRGHGPIVVIDHDAVNSVSCLLLIEAGLRSWAWLQA